ncbi:tetratricopeptide repeat protein [Helicobacter sp. T3_23-1056]
MKNSGRFTLVFWILASTTIFSLSFLHASFILDPNLDYCENEWYLGSCAQQKAQGGVKVMGKHTNMTNENSAQLDDNGGLASEVECTLDKEETNNCVFLGSLSFIAELYIEAIQYYEKAIALGDNRGYHLLGLSYDKLGDYFNAKKYLEIGCNKVSDTQSESCYNLGVMYIDGKGVRQDYHKARELWKKACDMKNAMACHNLGVLYARGKGVKQNRSIAKQYYGKACDLGEQTGCDNYKQYNEAGVQ